MSDVGIKTKDEEWDTSFCHDCNQYVKDDGGDSCPQCGAPRLTDEEADNI